MLILSVIVQKPLGLIRSNLFIFAFISITVAGESPTPGFLPGESQGRGSLVGRRLWGRTESDTTEVT